MTSSLKIKRELEMGKHDYKMRAIFVRNMKIREISDRTTCMVTRLVILQSDRIVICDSSNSSLKLLDTKQNQISSQIHFPSPPEDTALMLRDVIEESTTHYLFVTLPDDRQLRQIEVTNDQITDTNIVIPVKGRCRGIQVTRDRKLMINYIDMGILDILELDGQVLNTIEIDDDGKPLFSDPMYLALSPGSDILYVSNRTNETVTSISTRDWLVKTKFKGLKIPQGITVDSAGSVFVCCWDGTIHIVAATGDRSRQILGWEDGLRGSPMAIGLSPEGDRIYVTGYRNDHVQEFRLEEKV